MLLVRKRGEQGFLKAQEAAYYNAGSATEDPLPKFHHSAPLTNNGCFNAGIVR